MMRIMVMLVFVFQEAKNQENRPEQQQQGENAITVYPSNAHAPNTKQSPIA